MEIPFFVRMRRQLARATNNVDADAADQLKGLLDLHQNIEQLCFRYVAALTLSRKLAASRRGKMEERKLTNDTKKRAQLVDEANGLRSWEEIPFRDSVMTVSHFHEALTEFSTQLNRSNALPQGEIDAQRTWHKVFLQCFPTHRPMRDTVAHEAENYMKENRRDQNTIREPFNLGDDVNVSGDATVILAGVIRNGEVAYSRDGTVIKSRLDDVGANSLRECLSLIETYLEALANRYIGKSQ